MNKKGDSLDIDIPVWAFNILVLAVILVIFASITWTFLTRNIDVSEYEPQLVLYKAYSCLSYEDERNNFGIIDANKFPLIESCFNNEDLQLNITIETLNGEKIDTYYNKKEYDLNKNLKNIKIKNEKYTFYEKKDYVLLVKDNKKQGAILNYDVIFENV
ncbi:MAG: hypothetical protein WC413_03455 [Candidatus Nanoarchaeia archaeon]